MENKEGFEYIYSAAQQQEVEHIRQKYLPMEESKLEQLQRLDASVGQKATMYALIVGIVGALVMGSGMSLCMTDLGAALGNLAFMIGVPLGIAGIALVALAYPVYNTVLKKQRARIAPEVLRLTDELLK